MNGVVCKTTLNEEQIGICACLIRTMARCIYCGQAICSTCGVYVLDGKHCQDCYEKEVVERA